MTLIDALVAEYPGQNSLTRPQIYGVASKLSMGKEYTKFVTNPDNKIRHGLYRINSVDPNTESANVNFAAPRRKIVETAPEESDSNSLVPRHDELFVGYGDFALLKKLVKSGSFFPVYIAGESGNGKTKMAYQACAATGRELIRANITETTDEDDLVGGYRLVNGETVWQDGPAIVAMKRGAILLLDEINLASPKIMCLQPILEGSPIYIKKTNCLVHPKSGFNIILTANTKGKSSDDGRYIGSNTLNEALLDRIAITIEHTYPPADTEVEILSRILTKFDVATPSNKDFAIKLVEWAKIIRDTYNIGGVEELITTRRLIHIIQCCIITGMTRVKAIKYCISRFDDDTKSSFFSLYQKVDETVAITPTGSIIEDTAA